jgi:NAD(P)-dependent dehydrogenase (short-subunit alcohol dehydrogenase family)
MTRRLEGKVGIVTGASRGIGLGIARRLVDEGAKVCCTARNAEALAEAVESLGGPEHALAVPGRADDAEHQADAVARTMAAFGPVDLMVNNTGINPAYGPLMDIDLGAARKMVEVNCLAPLGWIRQLHAASMAERGGAIVNVSSLAGMQPTPGIGFYGATKAMLGQLTRQLALELGPGIRINAVVPAVIKTRFGTALYEGKEDEVASVYPMKRLGLPEDVSGAVAFLLSDDAAWITGQLMVIDGGVSLTGGS